MKERPILFNGAMIRALLAGTKTQTRRALKPQPLGEIGNLGDGEAIVSLDGRQDRTWVCPYGAPGDRLWCRETWISKAWSDAECTRVGCSDSRTHPDETYLGNPMRAIYRASYSWPEDCGPWRPSIFMPRWASRITLEITDVRVQRVQEISLDDARAEGIPQMHGEAEALGLCAPRVINPSGPDCRDIWDNRTSAENYAALWDSINGKRAPWASNPWVWALTFRRIT